VERVAEYLDRKDERRRIAESGYAWVTSHRTFKAFAREVLGAVAGSPPVYEGREAGTRRPGSKTELFEDGKGPGIGGGLG
jgi:hypothetical protein